MNEKQRWNRARGDKEPKLDITREPVLNMFAAFELYRRVHNEIKQSTPCIASQIACNVATGKPRRCKQQTNQSSPDGEPAHWRCFTVPLSKPAIIYIRSHHHDAVPKGKEHHVLEPGYSSLAQRSSVTGEARSSVRISSCALLMLTLTQGATRSCRFAVLPPLESSA